MFFSNDKWSACCFHWSIWYVGRVKIPQKTVPLGLFSSSGDYLSDPAGSSRIPGWQSVVIVRKICTWYLGRELSIFIYQYMLLSHVHARYRDMVESQIQKPKRKQSLSASQFLSISPLALCFSSQRINMFSTTHVSSHFFLNFSFTMFFSQKDPIFLPKCSSKFNSTPPLPSCLGPTPNCPRWKVRWGSARRFAAKAP